MFSGVGEQEKEFFLDWKTRLQIALNSAQGTKLHDLVITSFLCYLLVPHESVATIGILGAVLIKKSHVCQDWSIYTWGANQ